MKSLLACFFTATQLIFVTVCAAAHPLPDEVLLYQPDTGRELIGMLKQHSLWTIEKPKELPPVVVSNYPDDLHKLSSEDRKKVFLHSLLPAASIALSEISQERAILQDILQRIEIPVGKLDFAAPRSSWRKDLQPEEIAYVTDLAEKYRTSKAQELLARVDTLPVSLIMAQAAFESSWGTSRFAREGNNLFGILTSSPQGINPEVEYKGRLDRVARYETILDSLRNYLLTINRHTAYKDLRTLRRQTSDPKNLAAGLVKYSERRKEYVDDIRRVISANGLGRYDRILVLQTNLALTAATAQPEI